MDLVCKFTERSDNPDNYGVIHANLKTPFTQYSTLTIDSLTTNACFEVLNESDYIIFEETNEEEETNQITIKPNEKYSDLNSSSVSTMINDLLNVNASAIRTVTDNTNRIVFKNQYPFQIIDCSYNMRLILGLYDQTFPIESVQTIEEAQTINIIQCLSVGCYLSTAILYLIANIGDKCFINGKSGRVGKRILMRINNSYSANFPVIANNAEFSTYALSNDFSDITFQLVDGNLKPIKLLSPMYLTGSLTADVNSETINTGILITPEMMGKNNDEEA